MRRADQRDATAVLALTRRAYAKWVPILGREPKPMTADYARAIEMHRIDLLLIDGEIAALIEMIAEPRCLLIESVAVEPRRQGHGYGRLLLSHAEDVAVSAGCPSIRLYTNRMMAANIELYARCGYALDREESLAHGTIVHMSKWLIVRHRAPNSLGAPPDGGNGNRSSLRQR